MLKKFRVLLKQMRFDVYENIAFRLSPRRDDAYGWATRARVYDTRRRALKMVASELRAAEKKTKFYDSQSCVHGTV